MSEPQLLSTDPRAGLSSGAPPPLSTDELLQQAHAAADAGDMEGANAAFFQIPADERKARGLYAGPGGADPVASGSAAATLGGASVTASVARSILGGGPSLAGKAIAGAKASVAAATPIVKYEATKTLLEKMGVPSPLAVAAAMAVSGYERGGKTPATARTAEATVAAPAEAELAGAARPTPRPLPTAPATAAPPDLGKILKTLMTEGGLNLEEANQALKWRKAGVSLETIQDRIQAARQLAGKPAFVKLPSSADVAAAVKDRNTDGRWPE